ncbi:MAG: (E)-4-hydroxy-3-methylbut-2-enyl-diphosphate synthase [Chlamydiia bacterium]|nr:(E)-4-hydroxy-3-methylbut-2-enyl-diphosphate synthase [Chlamydiia bacterium]
MRRKTREVKVGKVGVGGLNPVRIQSMTTSNTRDVEATTLQIMRLADSGCEIARVTVQGKKEAYACEGIKNSLIQKGYEIPLVADIHFYPPAAMLVAEFVDKVRVNPGNYVDPRASFRTLDYDDAAYAAELERIDEGFSPLVLKCKQLGRAMRIGTNHGSLSDRIMNRFGDSPMGMVESALEFAKVCRKYDYHDFMFSMKSSNPIVMVEAYRQLVEAMDKLGWDYPLHLGVTEAGNGEEGRVKSSVGIGTLLLDGLGDTIRVSLTEDPWAEIDPCQRLIALAEKHASAIPSPIFKRSRQESPLHRDGAVILAVSEKQILDDDFYSHIGCQVQFGKPVRAIDSADALVLKETVTNPDAQEKLAQLEAIGIQINPQVLYFEAEKSMLHEGRRFFKEHPEQSVVLLYKNDQDPLICASAELGALLMDGCGEGICLYSVEDLDFARRLSFNILQACRMRTTKTDFIACPGCGRTLFDLQEVTERIKAKTAHLPGVKIAIMGCIVNGPGEMADADFGYVGSRTNKIDLYVGKTCVEKGIDHADADERLVELIKAHGRWVEPTQPLCQSQLLSHP